MKPSLFRAVLHARVFQRDERSSVGQVRARDARPTEANPARCGCSGRLLLFLRCLELFAQLFDVVGRVVPARIGVLDLLDEFNVVEGLVGR